MLNEFLNCGTIVSTRKNHLLIGWGKRSWSQFCSQDKHPNFYFPDFFLKNKEPWFTHEFYKEISLDELAINFPKILLPKPKWDFHDFSFFEEKFNELLQKIHNQQLIKAVPYFFEKTEEKMCQKRLEVSIHYALAYAKKYPVNVYGFWDENEGFFGVTPEILFKYDQKKLKTMALAGTYPSVQKQKIDAKLKLEHQVVVDSLLSSLEDFGNVTLSPLKKISFGMLTHLATHLNVDLIEAFEFTKLVQSLHPTPALGAYPKEKGQHFLEEYQSKVPRDRFGAPVGFSFKNKAKCFVAIRNVQWDKNGMQIGAGCGVVQGSDLEMEKKEILLKLNAIKEMLYL